jgi:hypothetical protein
MNLRRSLAWSGGSTGFPGPDRPAACFTLVGCGLWVKEPWPSCEPVQELLVGIDLGIDVADTVEDSKQWPIEVFRFGPLGDACG